MTVLANENKSLPLTQKQIMKKINTVIFTLVGAVAALYVLITAALYFGQTYFLYPAPAGGMRPAAEGWETVKLGKERHVAYYLPPQPGKPVLVFFHGNGTGYDASVVATQGFANKGIGILIPEYPGYGGNDGTPSEKSLKQTADNAYSWLQTQRIPSNEIYIYGNSIGTGPAVYMAKQANAGLIIVSGVANLRDVVHKHIPFLIPSIINDVYDNKAEISKVISPVLIMHAKDDEVVPFEQGLKLHESVKSEFKVLANGNHVIAFDPKISDILAKWVEDRHAEENRLTSNPPRLLIDI